jgi:hypothetical protein
MEEKEIILEIEKTETEILALELEKEAEETIELEQELSVLGGAADVLELITYEEIKMLRDNALLEQGCYYRITDYETTTVQEATQSAGHKFDIIVHALSESVLDEEAKAIQSEGDEYFANNNLAGWQLWYTLDNDTSRFAWADENGKGVIYRLIDENGNDLPYDFKNIQMLDANNSEDTTYYYTFDSSGIDHSLNGSLCFNNVINKYISGTQRVNRIIFKCRNAEVSTNFFDFECYNNTMGSCDHMKFGRECYGNVFGGMNHLCTFETKFRNNFVGSETQSIQVGQGASNNYFNACTYYSTFGNYFRNNKLPKYLYYSSFGHYVQNIILGENEDNLGQYMRFLTFENNVTYLNLYKTDATTKTYMENIKICSGTNGTSSKRINIEVSELAQKYAITYGKTSTGELKKYCDADKEEYTADDIKFEDGTTFQEKYNSGDLNGKDGIDGKDGADGYTPVKGKDYFDGVNGKDGIDGKDGADGYTPVKGTDYYTEEDKQEMVNSTIDTIKNQNIYVDKEEFEDYIKTIPVDGVLYNVGHFDKEENLPDKAQQSGIVGSSPKTFDADPTKSDINISDLNSIITSRGGMVKAYIFGAKLDENNYIFLNTDYPEIIKSFAYGSDGSYEIYVESDLVGTGKTAAIYYSCNGYKKGFFISDMMIEMGMEESMLATDMVWESGMDIPEKGTIKGYIGGNGQAKIFGNLPNTIYYKTHGDNAYKRISEMIGPMSVETLPNAGSDSLTLAFANDYTYNEGMEVLRFDENYQAYWITDKDGAKENDVATVGIYNKMYVVDSDGEWKEWNKPNPEEIVNIVLESLPNGNEVSY